MKIKKFNLPFTILNCFLFISGCQAQQVIHETGDFQYLTTVEIDNKKIELINESGRCSIHFNNSPVLKLNEMPYPCGFVRSNSKLNPQTYFYDDIGHVYIIAGPLISKQTYTNDVNVNFEHRCSNEGQVLTVLNGELKLIKSFKREFGFCHNLGFDEKDFYGFSHNLFES